MAMAPTTEQQSQRIDLGQRFFLLGVFGILVSEALATIVNVGLAFTWTGALLGIVSAVVILYLGNRLYVGDKVALTATRVWLAVELAVVITALAILLGNTPAESTIPVHLNISAAWQGCLKLAAYVGFAAAVFLPGFVLDFFAAQRGESVVNGAAPAAETSAATGEPVTLANDQLQALDGLSGAMKMACGLLIVVGGFELVAGLLSGGSLNTKLSVGEGFAFMSLGLVLLAPLKLLQFVLAATPRTMGIVMAFLQALTTIFLVYLVLFVALIVVGVWRLFL
jgi:hypothetical protein